MLVNQFARTCTTVLTLVGLSCVCTPAQSQADADRISSLERHLEQSNQLIQQLERAADARAQKDEPSATTVQAGCGIGYVRDAPLGVLVVAKYSL